MFATVHSDADMLPMGLAYWALTISFNIALSILISFRLWTTPDIHWRHWALSHEPETKSPDWVYLYERVIDIMIESAAPYSIFGVLQLVAYTRDYGGMRRLFQGALGEVQVSLFHLILLYLRIQMHILNGGRRQQRC